MAAILFFGGHLVFEKKIVEGQYEKSGASSLKIEWVMFSFVIWHSFVFGGHFVFWFFLQKFNKYYHAKSGVPSLKIYWVLAILFWLKFWWRTDRHTHWFHRYILVRYVGVPLCIFVWRYPVIRNTNNANNSNNKSEVDTTHVGIYQSFFPKQIGGLDLF